MSSRRRTATWQDEVARSFSRLFSRTPSQEKEEESGEEQDRGDRSLSRLFFRSSSQEKKDGSDRTEQGEEQERSHSPSRLFFRRITQEGKGGTDNVSPARGSKEEQDRSKSFSRLFTRTSSQEKEEENDSSRGAREEPSRHEDDHSALNSDRRDVPPLAEPEQFTPEQASSPPLHNISEPENGEFTPNSKVLDSEKQSRENFFHFIGNLFHFSPKSPLGNWKQGAGVPEPCKEHEDTQVKNNLDKDHLDQERTGEDQSATEEASEHNRARQEQENPGVSAGGNPKDVLEGLEDATANTKFNGHAQDPLAVTYGTYRGSKRIRKLLKRRADVNSPILEKEETPETLSVGHVPTENCLMLHEWVKMEPVPDRNCLDEIPPSKIYIKMQSKFEPFDQYSKLHNDDNIIQKGKDSKLTNGLAIETKDEPIYSNSGEVEAEKSSEVIKEQQPNIEDYVRVVPQPNAKESSNILQPNTRESLEDLQPTLGGSLGISVHLEQNVENSKEHSTESTISNKLEPNDNGHRLDVEPNTLDTADIVGHSQQNSDEVSMQPKDLQPSSDEVSTQPKDFQSNSDEISMQPKYLQSNSNEVSTRPKDLHPNFKPRVHFSEILQKSIDADSKTETDPSPKVAENVSILCNAKEDEKDHLTEHVHVDISNSENFGTFSLTDNLQSEYSDTLVRTEELEGSSEENIRVPVDLGNCLNANMQSASQHCNLKMVLDSGGYSSNLQAAEDKPHNDPSNLHPTTHNTSDRSSSKKCKDSDSSISDCLKPEIERKSNTIDLQPNAQLVSSCTVDVEPKIMGNSAIEELLQLHGEEYPNQPNQELNRTFLNKTLSDSEDIPNLHLQLNKTSEHARQLEHGEHLQKNANMIPQNNLQNDGLLKTELQPNTNLKELNHTFVEKTQSESVDMSNLDLQLSETSGNAKDLKQIGNEEHLQKNAHMFPENDPQNDGPLKTELQPHTNLKELTNTFLEKTSSQLGDIPNLGVHLSETSGNSKDLKPIGNEEHVQINAKMIPKNDLQNDLLLKTELQPNTKVTLQLKELNNTFFEITPAESGDVQNSGQHLSETSRNSKDLNQIGNEEYLQKNVHMIPENDLQNDEQLIKPELQPNTKVTFQLKELNNTFLEKTLAASGDVPNSGLHLSETSGNSKNVKQIANIEHLQKNVHMIPENDAQKDGDLLQPNTTVTFQLKENLDESPLKSGIISEMIENQKPNLHIGSHVSDGVLAEEPSKVNLCLESHSEIHVPEISNDSSVHKVSQRNESVSDEVLTETSHSNGLADEDKVHVDQPDGAAKELDIKPAIFYDNPDNMTVPETSLNDISSFIQDHKAVTSRNISFDNGIECRSPSPVSDSASYIDCNDVQCDSPNDSGIVSSQAYTPEEHILFKTFPSEIFLKNIPDLFAVDQKSEEASTLEPDGRVNGRSVVTLQNRKPVIIINDALQEEHGSLVDGCTSNSGTDDYIKTSTPDKLTDLNSDVFVAKVSMKTINIEEVKISPYSLCSDIISVAKLESPTFTKEVICIPNLSPAIDTENTFQVFNCVADDKAFVTNRELLNNRGEYLTVKECGKWKNCYLETDGLPSDKDNDTTMNLISDLPNNDNSDSIPQYTCREKESPNMTDKSPDVLIENLKNNNINVCTSDNIINVSLPAHKSEGLMSSDSLKELRLGESLSELNPDSRMNHREKLSDLLLHSALLHDVTDTNEIISSCSTTAKMILPGKDHSETSNESFEQKANEIIFSVLHSAIDELQNISQSHMIMSVNHHSLPDIKHVKENLCENLVDLEDHHDEDLRKCPGKPSDLIEDSDLIMSVAVGIVNDVIASSKQLVVSKMIQNGLSKDVTANEASRQKPLSDFKGLFMKKRNDPSEDATNSNHVVSSLGCDNVIHLPSCEINSNVLQVTTEVSQKVESSQAKEPDSSNQLGSRVTEDMCENDVESNKTEYEDLSFSGSSVKADTYNLINKSYTNGHLTLDGLYCDRQLESISLESEGSMEDLIYNNIHEESGDGSEFLDFFSIYNSRYVEISGSDDESTDEEKESGSEQASGNDSFLPVQSRRVRIYPYALSPIYEDDSACEDTLSNSGSPRYNQGATASSGGHDHTSILSLLQSVSDRLKEADLEDERFSSLSNEVSGVNDSFKKETSGELENIICPSKTSLDVTSTLEHDKASLGARSGLFITKSFTDNKPNPVSGRQSFLLNLTSQSNVYGAKLGVESSSVPSFRSEASGSPAAEPNPHQNTDPSPSTAAVNSRSAEPALSIQGSALDHKPRISPKSVYYQYYNAAQNYLSDREDNEYSAQEKLEEPKKTVEVDVDPADSDSLKSNPRPGKVILSDILDQENKTELKADVLDATSWVFPNGVNIRVIRGCWILYEKPHFGGQAHVLEEGEAVLRHLGDLSGADAKPDTITIGSVKRVEKDHLPEVVISSLQDVSDSPIYIRTEVPSLENLVGKHPRSLIVNSGVWLAYAEPQYNGAVSVLEEGSELPQIQDSGLKSMRPLKMGGLKVQLPSDPRMIIYEKPNFQGRSREITDHISSIGMLTWDGDESGGQEIGSIQVMGGVWVGYENERYKGHQYLLEEGDYKDWHAWGGYNNTLQSIRYLQADFLESSVTLYETDEEDRKQINLFNQAIPDLELAGYNTRTQCIHVTKGMWVAYRQKHFCGEQYVLEKGRYKTFVDWGGSDNTILSIRPVLLEPLGQSDVKHLIKVYTRPEFQGDALDLTQGVSDFTSFMPKSIKVLRGCWLLCYKADSGDNLCVLEEGHFPDLASCGCPAAEIKSIRPIDYVFAEPSVSLFALDSCEGRELHFEEAVTSVLSKDLHFYAQSMWVRRGLWIAFEGANFLGRQMLLDPQQILNWSQFSGWKAIGSLRPLKQPSVYFMIKNRDKYLTVTGKLSDTRAAFVSVSPRNGQSTQIWYFCRGFLKSKVNDFCLDVIGGKNILGSKVSLWVEHGKTRQKWKINSDGTISSYISDDLVLDIRGGNYYDQNYLVVNKVQENAATQKWDIEIL